MSITRAHSAQRARLVLYTSGVAHVRKHKKEYRIKPRSQSAQRGPRQHPHPETVRLLLRLHLHSYRLHPEHLDRHRQRLWGIVEELAEIEDVEVRVAGRRPGKDVVLTRLCPVLLRDTHIFDMNTYMHTCIYTCMHACMHACIHT
jgi:hypothetical protein